MKISWGYKILFVYLAFVAGIIFLVAKASNEHYELVTENYYEAELKYQDVIDQRKRVSELSTPITITHSPNSVRVVFPPELANKALQGNIYLYRPSDATKDIRRSFATKAGSTEITMDVPLSGAYDLKLTWQAEGKTFYQEKRIFF